jgi:hypothetical protein
VVPVPEHHALEVYRVMEVTLHTRRRSVVSFTLQPQDNSISDYMYCYKYIILKKTALQLAWLQITGSNSEIICKLNALLLE